MQKSQLDVGIRQGTSVMKAMQNLTIFSGGETPTEKNEPVRSPRSNSKYPLANLKVHAQRMFAEIIEVI